MPRLFARSTDKIDVGNDASLMPTTPNLTFGGWAKFTDFTADNWCYAKYNTGTIHSAHLLRVLSTGKVNVFWLDNNDAGHGPTGATTLSTGIWYHVLGRINDSGGASNKSDVFLSGIADAATDSVSNVLSPWGSSTTINSRLGSSLAGNTLAGSLAHWGFWSRALSDKEILLLAKGLLPSHLGADHYWPIFGVDSPEPDYGTHAVQSSGTVTGTTLGVGGPPVAPYLHVVRFHGASGGYTVPGATAYTDAATATLPLSVSSTEVDVRVDSGTAIVPLTPSSSDVAADVDAATATVSLQASGTETAGVDAATATLLLTPSVVETDTHTDSGTGTVVLTPSGVDTRQSLDSGTATLVLTPSADDCHCIFSPDFSGTIKNQWKGEIYSQWLSMFSTRWKGDLVEEGVLVGCACH